MANSRVATLSMLVGTAAFVASLAGPASAAGAEPAYYDVAKGSHPHDVAAAPAAGGPVYYTAQTTGKLGILDPKSGKHEEISLGPNSAPHGVIVGPDGAAWVTDGGQNAIVRVDSKTRAVRVWPLPKDAGVREPQHADVRSEGPRLVYRQSGYYGRLVPETGDMKVWKAPRGRGPYGITTTPAGDVYYASLAGNHIARIDTETGEATVIEPPTPVAGRAARLVGFARTDMGELLEHGPGRHVRPGDARLGASGRFRAIARGRIRSGSTTRTRSGSPNGRRTRSSASIRSPKSSKAIRRTAPAQRCGRCWGAPARRGARSREPSAW